jgi:hypothetical protein
MTIGDGPHTGIEMSTLSDKLNAFFKSAEMTKLDVTIHARASSGDAKAPRRSFAKIVLAALLTMSTAAGVNVLVDSNVEATVPAVAHSAAFANPWPRGPTDDSVAPYSKSEHIGQPSAMEGAAKERPAIRAEISEQDLQKARLNEIAEEILDNVMLTQTALDVVCSISSFVDARTGLRDALFHCSNPDGTSEQSKVKETGGGMLRIGMYGAMDVYYSMGTGVGESSGSTTIIGVGKPVLFIEHELLSVIKRMGMSPQERKAIVAFFMAREATHAMLQHSPSGSNLDAKSAQLAADVAGIKKLFDDGLSRQDVYQVAQNAFECMLVVQIERLDPNDPNARSALSTRLFRRFVAAAAVVDAQVPHQQDSIAQGSV